MFLWLGFNVSPEFVQDVFGVGSPAQINIDTGLLLELDNPRSQRINGIIRKVRSQRSRFMKVNSAGASLASYVGNKLYASSLHAILCLHAELHGTPSS